MATYPFDQPTQQEPPEATQTQGSAWSQQQATQPPAATGGYPASVPPVDIVDGAEELVVYLDMPGFEQEEIQVRGDETTLTVSAVRITEFEEGHNVVVQERPLHVERSINLPAPVDVEEATAHHENGICTIRLPKSAAERYAEITFE